METTVQERVHIELPDFLSLTDTVQFVQFLKDHEDQYGVKTLLYHSEMIQGHLKRIAKHTACATRILVRVNGSVSPNQRKAYDMRAARTLALKFYSAMSDGALDNELELHGYNDCRGYTRTDVINILVKEYIARDVREYHHGESC